MRTINLTEADLEKIVRRVLKESNDSQISDEIKNEANKLVGKTMRVLKAGADKIDLSGIYEIIKTTPSNKDNYNLLSLGLQLKRLTDFSTNDVNDNSIYYVNGKCFGKVFKWEDKIGRNKNGQYAQVPATLSSKLSEYLFTNWCSLYKKEEIDY